MSKITAKHYAIALHDLLSAAQGDQRGSVVRNFLAQLYQAGQLRLLPGIIQAFEQYHYAQAKVIPVHIKIAEPLPADFIQQQLVTLFPQATVQPITTIDPAVVGSMIVETPNQRWNLSLAGQLNTLANTLKN